MTDLDVAGHESIAVVVDPVEHLEQGSEGQSLILGFRTDQDFTQALLRETIKLKNKKDYRPNF